jgi:hypothetical protein
MNQKQINFVNMTQAVLTHTESKPEVWNTIPPVATAVQELRTHVQAILQEGYTQAERQTTGHTGQKNAQFESLCDAAYSLMLKIRAYAKRQQNQVLLQAVGYSKSELCRKPEADVINRCQAIHDRGQENLSKLADYQVTKDGLKKFQAAILAYKPLTAKRDLVSSERNTATANIVELLDKARMILDEMDDLMEGVVTDTTFVHTYQQTRKTFNRGGRSEKKEIKEN